MNTSNNSHTKHANGIPADIEQPSMLISQESIHQTSSKTKYGMFVVLWAVLVIPALVVVYFSLFAPTGTVAEMPIKPPTNRPIQGPIIATPEFTTSPTRLNPTQVPSASPTLVPTMSPTEVKSAIQDFLFEDDFEVQAAADNPAVSKAMDWLIDEASAARSLFFPFDQKYLQRFGILIFYYSVFKDRDFELGEVPIPNIGMRTQDECFWRGMKCDENGMLIEIKLINKQLDGVLPSSWNFFPHLKSIDLSKNGLQGNIPEELYDLVGLEQIYLYKNQLQGTISSKIGRLFDLTHFHVSNNKISGTIPPEIASHRQMFRQLRYFNVHRNEMTGSIPSNLNLRQMFYMDLGYNKFDGELPPELGNEYVRLRHLYLDHNNFEGSVPESYINAGNGRIQTLTLNNNNFTGAFPGNHEVYNRMLQLRIENNNFDSMDKSTCQLGIFSGGELVEFKSDCLVCRCGVAFMCRNCELS
mmetsp:Transcript_38149/g.92323  ORF Transcript_38149/g.92323 Transcript_38149/m.92323 type:complete len:470 (-) Transcript_38149:307-1716(-)